MAGESTPDDERITDLSTQLEAAVKRAGELAQSLADDKNEHVAEIRVELETQKNLIAGLLDEQRALHAKAEHAAAVASIDDLTKQVEELKSWRTPRKHEWAATAHQPGEDGESFAVKLWKARKGDYDAYRELKSATVKALSEGTSTAGGFLVPPQYIQDLVALRRATAPLRDWVTVMPVNSNLVYVPRQTTAELVAWTAENAPKTSTDEVFAQISVNIFTLAGIAKISNQLLEDASPMVDAVVKQSIGRGLGIEEDRAMINGTGTGQPTGILNTNGVTVTAASAQTAASLYDDILASVGRVQGGYFGQPTAVLMAPRTWSKLQTAKDSAGRFLGIGTVLGAAALNLAGYSNPTGAVAGPMMTMFGIPVIIDANVPIAQTVSSNTNRSSIIVGAFNECWLLEKGGDIRMDTSDVAGTSFEQNQTWFRGEERVGFTAARLTSALDVISDVGP